MHMHVKNYNLKEEKGQMMSGFLSVCNTESCSWLTGEKPGYSLSPSNFYLLCNAFLLTTVVNINRSLPVSQAQSGHSHQQGISVLLLNECF